MSVLLTMHKGQRKQTMLQLIRQTYKFNGYEQLQKLHIKRAIITPPTMANSQTDSRFSFVYWPFNLLTANTMNTQLDMFPEQVIHKPTKPDERLRVSRGQYCTPEQKQKDEITLAIMGEETKTRHDIAVWEILRTATERIAFLENRLLQNNLRIR